VCILDLALTLQNYGYFGVTFGPFYEYYYFEIGWAVTKISSNKNHFNKSNLACLNPLYIRYKFHYICCSKIVDVTLFKTSTIKSNYELVDRDVEKRREIEKEM